MKWYKQYRSQVVSRRLYYKDIVYSEIHGHLYYRISFADNPIRYYWNGRYVNPVTF